MAAIVYSDASQPISDTSHVANNGIINVDDGLHFQLQCVNQAHTAR